MFSTISRPIGHGGIALLSLITMCWGQSATSTTSATTYSPCDLGQYGTTNPNDIQLAINMALGTTPCTANVEGADVCTVITVQRVTNWVDGGVCITYNTHQVTLSWTASTSTGVTGYDVYRSTTSGGPYTQVGTATSSPYTDTSVSAGQTYYYVVTTVATSGQSGYSSQVSATTPTP